LFSVKTNESCVENRGKEEASRGEKSAWPARVIEIVRILLRLQELAGRNRCLQTRVAVMQLRLEESPTQKQEKNSQE